MHIFRIFHNISLIEGETFTLSQLDHHHLRNVLRLSEDAKVECCDGQGTVALCRILKQEKKTSRVLIENVSIQNKKGYNSILAQGMPSSTKAHIIVEKATELGIDSIVFFKADNSTKNAASEKILEKLRNVSIAALKQSKNRFLPTITFATLDAILEQYDHCYYGDVSRQSSQTIQRNRENVFINGPESGFSANELLKLSIMAQPLSLGKTILRTETAAIIGSFALTSNICYK